MNGMIGKAERDSWIVEIMKTVMIMMMIANLNIY